MKKYPAPAAATTPAPIEAPKPVAQTVEPGLLAGIMANSKAQSDMQDKLVQLVELVADQKNRVIDVEIIRDERSGDMRRLRITTESAL